MTPAEMDLVDGLVAGEEPAYEQLLREYAPRMHAVARRHLRNHADAQDAVQDALLSVVRAIGTFRPGTALWPWLARIVSNASIDRLRARRTATCLHDGSTREDVVDVTPLVLVEQSSRRHEVRRAIARMPKPYRAPLGLRYVEDLSVEEIASRLELSEGAVKLRLHRGRHALRDVPALQELGAA